MDCFGLRAFLVLVIAVGLIANLAEPTATLARPTEADVGNIEGTVCFTGEVPPATKIATTDGGTISHRDLIVDPKTKGLRDVVVMLEDAPAQPKIEKAQSVLIDQRDMVFTPRVVAVRFGQAVRFENSDNCNHSVMATSTKAANQFNLFVTTKPYEHVFEPQKHPVQIGCSLHPWMRAWDLRCAASVVRHYRWARQIQNPECAAWKTYALAAPS
jgi:plastocyanin